MEEQTERKPSDDLAEAMASKYNLTPEQAKLLAQPWQKTSKKGGS